jgi:hypothetical protein
VPFCAVCAFEINKRIIINIDVIEGGTNIGGTNVSGTKLGRTKVVSVSVTGTKFLQLQNYFSCFI